MARMMIDRQLAANLAMERLKRNKNVVQSTDTHKNQTQLQGFYDRNYPMEPNYYKGTLRLPGSDRTAGPVGVRGRQLAPINDTGGSNSRRGPGDKTYYGTPTTATETAKNRNVRSRAASVAVSNSQPRYYQSSATDSSGKHKWATSDEMRMSRDSAIFRNEQAARRQRQKRY